MTPGLVALIVTGDGKNRFLASVGRTSFYDGAPETSPETIYDLASLTKVLSTTTAVAALVDDKKIDLEETPWSRWPEVTVADALSHTGGLLWWRAFFDEVPPLERGTDLGKRAIIDAVLDTPPSSARGKTVYSDLGFIALGALVEERAGGRLEVVFDDVARSTFGDTELRYVSLPADAHHPALPRVAPTERCKWRARCVHGQVHDDNAFAMGGVAGHAGLFGTVLDVERAALAFLQAHKGDSALGHFTKTKPTGLRWLGFDVADADGTTGGVMSERAFGHLGFTGTSMWVDPALDAVFVLLSNRVHPDRDDKVGIRELRVGFHRAAHAWLTAR